MWIKPRHWLLLSLVTTAAGAAVAPDTAAPRSPAGHPLIGTWRADIPQLQCTEVLEFRPDGTMHAESGQERGESKYTLSPTPSAKGFYQWTDTITSSNGKPDCTGNVVPIGDVATSYIRLSPKRDRFQLCFSEDADSCVAEYVRQK